MSPAVSHADLEALIAGNTAFAFDLYRSIVNGEGNLFFSLHGISMAPAMACAAARRETKRQMSETLRFDLSQAGFTPRSTPSTCRSSATNPAMA